MVFSGSEVCRWEKKSSRRFSLPDLVVVIHRKQVEGDQVKAGAVDLDGSGNLLDLTMQTNEVEGQYTETTIKFKVEFRERVMEGIG